MQLQWAGMSRMIASEEGGPNEHVRFATEEDGVEDSGHPYMQAAVQVSVGALNAMKWWGQAIHMKDARHAAAKAIIDSLSSILWP